MKFDMSVLNATLQEVLPKAPKAIGMLTFASTSAIMGRQCLLIARDCTIDWQALYNAILTEKSLKTACKVGFLGCSLFSQNSTIASIAILSLGMTATGLLAYRFGLELMPKKIVPVAPIVPMPSPEASLTIVSDTDHEIEPTQVEQKG